MDYFDCIFFGGFFYVDWTDDLAYLISMFSLSSWFLYFHGSVSCRTCSKRTKGKKPYGNIRIQNGQKSCILLGKKYYFIQKLKFYNYNNLFENVFQTSGVIDLITILYVQNSDPKQTFHWKLAFHNFRVISMF